MIYSPPELLCKCDAFFFLPVFTNKRIAFLERCCTSGQLIETAVDSGKLDGCYVCFKASDFYPIPFSYPSGQK